jgi:four helix bundle protein
MDYRDLHVYQNAFKLAMEIFHLTKGFPKEERYGLTGRIRRSSRSECSNFAEGYRKRQYEAHYLSKLSDCDMENTETRVWLDFSLACDYISAKEHQDLFGISLEVGRGINHMMNNREKFLPKHMKNVSPE